MTTDTVKYAKMTTESVVNFVFFETLTTEKSAIAHFQHFLNHFSLRTGVGMDQQQHME